MRPLLYAQEDARRLHEILVRLGGIASEDAELLLGKKAEDFLSALARMERKAQQASARGEATALFVYFSGHAKEGALWLDGTALPFEALKSRLAEAPADIRVAIFDACHSGAMTRAKGAHRAPAFEVETQTRRDARGLVILTSSAADEDSQESDEIGGSYFSHHLTSGLLGDADRSGDGRVTLSEAYAYAYDRTLADTAASSGGAQHATFSYALAGNGDWVITDLQRPEGVVLSASLPEGTYYLVDARGGVAAEVFKPHSAEKKLALAPGRYRIKRRMPERLRVADIQVPTGKLAWVSEAQFRDVAFSDDPVKGLSRRVDGGWTLAAGGALQTFLDGSTRATLFPAAPMVGAELVMTGFFRRNWDWGVDLAYGTTPGVLRLPGIEAIPYRFSELTVGTSFNARFALGAFTPFAGARVAFISLHRALESALVQGQTFATFSPGVFAGLSYAVSPHWSVSARGRLHYVLYNIEGNRSLAYTELGLYVGYQLGGSQ